jgi:hypothetical protein
VANINPEQSVRLLGQIIGAINIGVLRNQTNAGGGMDTSPDVDSYVVSTQRISFFGTTYFNAQIYFCDWDLSGISENITELTFKLYGRSGTQGNDGDLIVLEGDYDDSLATADWNNYTGWESGWDSDDVTEYSSKFGPTSGDSWNESGYNDISLNATAITAANNVRGTSNRLKFVVMNGSAYYDNSVGDLSSTPDYLALNFYTESTNPPILSITTETPSAGPSPRGVSLIGGSKIIMKGGKLIIK